MANDALLFIFGLADVDFAGGCLSAGYPVPAMKTMIVPRNVEAIVVDFI